jgi:hypothetical protein
MNNSKTIKPDKELSRISEKSPQLKSWHHSGVMEISQPIFPLAAAALTFDLAYYRMETN